MDASFDDVIAPRTRRVKRKNVTHRKKSSFQMAVEAVSRRTGLTVRECQEKLEAGWTFRDTLRGWSWEKP